MPRTQKIAPILLKLAVAWLTLAHISAAGATSSIRLGWMTTAWTRPVASCGGSEIGAYGENPTLCMRSWVDIPVSTSKSNSCRR